ncbi:MAG: LptE family protein [Thermonemataceae bacterium]
MMIPVLLGCGVYSMSGATTDAQSITVNNFLNSGGGPPNLAQTLTEDLKSYYLQNTRLNIVNEGGELLVEGEIIGYQTTPLAPTADDRAAQTRLTINVAVRFTNNLHPEKDFDQTFTQFADFDQDLSLAQVEGEKVQEILEKIIYDIFQKTVADW